MPDAQTPTSTSPDQFLAQVRKDLQDWGQRWLGACRTLGVEAKSQVGEDSFGRFCRSIVDTMDQKSERKWTGEVVLQPTFLKSDRLLGADTTKASLSESGCAALVSLEWLGNEAQLWRDGGRAHRELVCQRLEAIIKAEAAQQPACLFRYVFHQADRLWLFFAGETCDLRAWHAALQADFAGRLVLGAAVTTQTQDPYRLLASAEQARRAAYHHEQGVVIHAVSPRHQDDQALIEVLRRAIAQQSFQLVYQPQIGLHDGQCHGVEALLRLPDPVARDFSTQQILGLAQRMGWMDSISEQVIDTAIRDASVLAQGRHAPRIAINLTASMLARPDFPAYMASALQRHQVDGQALMIEITEQAMVQDFELAARVLRQLHGLGIQSSLDDFGTGYSALAYLSQLPTQEIKIDQSFVQRLPLDPRQPALVSAIINLAHHFSMTVVAEGIETAEAADTLRKLGCDWGQGWHFGRPLPFNALQQWLTAIKPQ